MLNLKFDKIFNFLENVCSRPNFYQIWATVLKLYTNIIYQ